LIYLIHLFSFVQQLISFCLPFREMEIFHNLILALSHLWKLTSSSLYVINSASPHRWASITSCHKHISAVNHPPHQPKSNYMAAAGPSTMNLPCLQYLIFKVCSTLLCLLVLEVASSFNWWSRKIVQVQGSLVVVTTLALWLSLLFNTCVSHNKQM
jgi:hypothetical protein